MIFLAEGEGWGCAPCGQTSSPSVSPRVARERAAFVRGAIEAHRTLYGIDGDLPAPILARLRHLAALTYPEAA